MSKYEEATKSIAQKALVGQRIKSVRWLTKREAAAFGWDERPFEIELENGVKMFAAQDPEGNGPGALFLNLADCPAIVAVR